MCILLRNAVKIVGWHGPTAFTKMPLVTYLALFGTADSPDRNTKKSTRPNLRFGRVGGAANRSRTGTVSLPADFKSALSTYSNTAANAYILSRFWGFVKSFAS